jgi:hypothetical protein
MMNNGVMQDIGSLANSVTGDAPPYGKACAGNISTLIVLQSDQIFLAETNHCFPFFLLNKNNFYNTCMGCKIDNEDI